MNIGSRQIGLVWVWMLILYGVGQSQVVFNPKIGMESWSLKDEKEMIGESNHPGQMFGLNLILRKEKWLFIPGFEYHRISMENEDQNFSFNFKENHHAHYFVIPLQAGYSFFGDSTFKISALAGVDLLFFYTLDENDLGLEDDMFYGVTTALTGTLFFEFLPFFTGEVKYHHALQSMLKTRDDAKLRGWTVGVGVKF